MRRWLHPTKAARRGLVVLVWSACVAALAALVFIWLEDTPLDTVDAAALRVAYIAFMLRTFALHSAIALTAMACIALLVRQRAVAALLCALALGFAWPFLALLASRSPAEPAPGAREVRILSMNVLLTNPDARAALAFIHEQNPDIILVQEHTPAWHKILTDALAERYPFIVNEMRGDAFGQAVFSKHPFLEPPAVRLSAATQAASTRSTGVQGLRDPQIRVVISVDDAPLVVQNVHTVPPGDVSLFREQRVQFAELVRLARDQSRPLVMAGDFNATANSRHVRALLAAGLRDANALAGSGLGNTWCDLGPLSRLPGIRIDHVLVNARVRVLRHVVGPSIGSDHRPLLTCINMQ